jgi:hypothetical protein
VLVAVAADLVLMAMELQVVQVALAEAVLVDMGLQMFLELLELLTLVAAAVVVVAMVQDLEMVVPVSSSLLIQFHNFLITIAKS